MPSTPVCLNKPAKSAAIRRVLSQHCRRSLPHESRNFQTAYQTRPHKHKALRRTFLCNTVTERSTSYIAEVIHGNEFCKIFRPSTAERLCALSHLPTKDYRLSWSEQAVCWWGWSAASPSIKSKLITPKCSASWWTCRRQHQASSTAKPCQNANRADKITFADSYVMLAQALEEKTRRRESIVNRPRPGASYALCATRRGRLPLPALQPERFGVFRALTDINRFTRMRSTKSTAPAATACWVFWRSANTLLSPSVASAKPALASGRHIHIDDIVTLPQSCRKGCASRLWKKSAKSARKQG